MGKRADRPGWRWGLLALLGAATAGTGARAGDAGPRDFPATLVVDEPQVETEIAPQIAGWSFDDAGRTDLGAELSLQLANPFSVIIHPDYTVLRPGGGGFQALEAGAKYEIVADAAHEIVVSAGVSATLGATGTRLIDADTYTSIVPTVYYGKGAGDLPDGMAWARPFAVTGQIGFSAPTRAWSQGPSSLSAGIAPNVVNPYVVNFVGSLQYSLPYASKTLSAVGVPNLLARLVPLVEYEIDVPVADIGRVTSVGTIDPGLLWVDEARSITWGLEALIPINRASGTHPGVRLQLSYSFDAPWHLSGRLPD